MGNTEAVFRTIAEPTPEVLFKDRRSKFFGYAFPLQKGEEVKGIIEQLKTRHPTAKHFCYAWQLGTENVSYKINDDGEPKNSAGNPIYRQLQSYDLTNTIIVVVRIYGGAKLGVSGLIQAYKTTAQMALEVASIEEHHIQTRFELKFEYAITNEVMRVLKRLTIQIVSQKMDNKCSLIVGIPKSRTDMVLQEFEKIHQLKVKPT